MSLSERTFPVAEVAQAVGASWTGSSTLRISGVNGIDDAGAAEITFISSPEYAKRWKGSKAGAAVASRKLQPLFAEAARSEGGAADDRPILFVDDAEIAMIRLLEMFQSPEDRPAIGVHPTAVVHPSVTLGKNVRVGSHVSIDEGATIGDEVVLHSGVRLYAGVQIGAGTTLHGNVVVRERCRIGRQCIIHQNVSIGADGFGYRPNPKGPGLLKVPHIGNVIIEDDVEIGANTCIDRGKFGSTLIGAGTKIDNLCQIAHNCRIGRCCVIAGQAGFAGSTIIGDGVMIGGQVGVAEHTRIGNRVRIAAQSGVIRDVPDGATWAGTPADDAQTMLRQVASLRKLPGILRRFSDYLQGDQQ